ncbi:TPA: HNH endonuclease [Serratia marcescens]|uniref:HNH endonuclease n=1 Tax=Serratia nevei TaxID=2703794 RepID=UPI00313BBCF1
MSNAIYLRPVEDRSVRHLYVVCKTPRKNYLWLSLALSVCIAGLINKPKSEESLEHAIPQFMGGEFAPQQYMLRNVCKQCNNRLGLFVDASYAKSWFVTNGLSIAAHRLYTSLNDQPIPLVCIGQSKFAGLVLDEGQIAEHWVGPSGETIIWLRTDDKRLHGYSGGNPIDKKKKPSTAYLFLTSQDPTRWEIGIASFLEMFRTTKVRKILCARVVESGERLLPGFDAWSIDDESNISVVMAALKSGSVRGQIDVHVHFDQRFLAKLAMGVGCSLFGELYLDTDMAKEARKTCWPKDGESGQTRGSTTLRAPENPLFSKFIGYRGAVVFTVVNTGTSYTLSGTIDQAIPFVVELAPSTLSSPFINCEEGYALVLFPSLGKTIEMTLVELIAHSSGVKKHPELVAIDSRIEKSVEFWSQLASL